MDTFSLEENTGTNGIFVNKDSACENNCPGCSFGVNKADINQKKSLNELKLIIDNLNEKINFGENIIFQPGNILLNYNIEEIEELFEYSYNKTGKQSQWEIARLDERILDFLKSEKILQLLKEKKLFLNIGYLDNNLDLLKKIYSKIHNIGLDNRNEEIESKGYTEDFKNLEAKDYLNKLEEYIEQGKLEGFCQSSMRFAIHNLNGLIKGDKEKINDIINFLDFCGFKVSENDFKDGNKITYSHESGIWINIIIVSENKIKNGVVVWDGFEEPGYETCFMANEKIELDVIGDGTVRSHTNPCNGISFGNIIDDTSIEIQENFNNHLNRISNILTKYKYTNGFDQSLLCKKCLDGENPDIVLKDIIKYNIRFENQDIDKTNIGEIEILKYIIKEEYLAYKRKISSILFK